MARKAYADMSKEEQELVQFNNTFKSWGYKNKKKKDGFLKMEDDNSIIIYDATSDNKYTFTHKLVKTITRQSNSLEEFVDMLQMK